MADPFHRLTTNETKRAVRSLLIRLGRTSPPPLGGLAPPDRPALLVEAAPTARRARKPGGTPAGTRGRMGY